MTVNTDATFQELPGGAAGEGPSIVTAVAWVPGPGTSQAQPKKKKKKDISETCILLETLFVLLENKNGKKKTYTEYLLMDQFLPPEMWCWQQLCKVGIR